MAKRVVTKAPVKQEPIHQVHVDNLSLGDNSGYFGLILNVNKNGKAIRIANRFNEERVYILMDEVDELIDSLKLLKAHGVPTSVKKVVFDSKTTSTSKAKRAA